MKLDRKTLAALNGSIRKWEKIVAGTGVDKGWANCPLCKLFIEDNCIECPVMEKSGQPFCKNTPHEKWVELFDYYERRKDGRADTTARKTAARKEFAFLKRLLPKAKRA